ncbi:MAG: Hpt domain-containing protein [Bdellovibrionota bacterium]|nr:MAG: Hpt domain-containing protein [Bdellovibrionota bacterium]
MNTPIFDRKATLERVEGDVDLLRELVRLAINMYAEDLPKLRAGVAANDSVTVSEIAHSLKGAFGNIGAARCYALCGEIESLARAATLGDLRGRIENLDAEVLQFQSELQAVLDAV